MKSFRFLLFTAFSAIIFFAGTSSNRASAINYNAPLCGIGASPGSITSGGSTTLWWWSSNATSGTINGEEVPVSGGSKYFAPTKTDTYTFTVKGPEGTKTCSTKIYVNEPQPDLPTCGIGATPHSVERGQGTAVWWYSYDAVLGTLNGEAVDVDGSQWLYPQETTKYTFVGTGKSGNKATCEMTVEVTDPVLNPPLCSTGLSPEKVMKGEGTTFWWWTYGATSATLNGKYVEKLQGYTYVIPTNENDTYTLEVTGPGGKTTCTSKAVFSDPAPLCAIGFSPESVEQGKGTTLWWWSEYATEATINGEKVDTTTGYEYIYPTTTKEYTLELTGPGGTAMCSETVGVYAF